MLVWAIYGTCDPVDKWLDGKCDLKCQDVYVSLASCINRVTPDLLKHLSAIILDLRLIHLN